MHKGLWWQGLAETHHLEDAGVDWEKKIFKPILNWMDLAQERNRWWALLNLVACLRVPQNVENFFIS